MVIDSIFVYHFVHPDLRVEIIVRKRVQQKMGDWFWNSRAEKVEEKMGLFVYFPCLLRELWSLNCQKKCIFCNFVQTSARNLSLLKQFAYMDLKVLITVFQKMMWFIGVWATVHEILAIKTSKMMLTQQRFNKVLRFQTLISSKH